MIGITIGDISVGDTAQIVRRVDDGDIASFVKRGRPRAVEKAIA